jgi:ribosomal protein S18 acetylase RimI-like enzyme
LDHTLEENAARRALQKAMANKSVWIYHIYSQSLPGLSLIAGFLTTERRRPYSGSNVRSKADGGKGKGSVAITAVFTEESYRSRGVAESLVRTATRYYLVDLEYDYVSVYVDPRNETTCRVFSRVGYGIMDREVNEDIPVKLIRDALHIQWEEEKEKYQAMLDHLASQGSHQLQLHDKEQSFDSANGSLLPATSTTSQSLLTARNTLSLLTAANKEVSSAIEESSPTTAHAESGNLIPTAEENEAALQAENGKPLCTSSEEWQVVSLRSREVALVGTRSRARGHARRDDSKRLSSEGPWH